LLFFYRFAGVGKTLLLNANLKKNGVAHFWFSISKSNLLLYKNMYNGRKTKGKGHEKE
jgi:hypothetical protein